MSRLKTSLVRYLKNAGAGSMIISITVHVIILGLATAWVINSVQKEPKNNPSSGISHSAPAVQHPVKMSNTQPNLDTLGNRLVVDTASSSVILPDSSLGGPGSNNLSTTGGLGKPGEDIHGVTNLSGPVIPRFLGSTEAQPDGNFVGRFYDLKQFRTRKPNPDLVKLGPGRLAIEEVTEFIKSGWRTGSLARFYQAPTVLYATQIFVPIMSADEAPKAYAVEKEVQPRAWLAHYRGRVSPPANGTYRFVGAGDDLMAVRFDGRLVLDCGGTTASTFKTDGPAKPAYNYSYRQNEWNVSRRGGFVVGNRMELKAGLFYDLDIVFSEGPGGLFCAMLLFEQEGVTYSKGNPVLPIFRLANNKTEPVQTGPQFDSDGPIWRAVARP